MAKFNDVTIGQVEACINRMGGMENFSRFIAGQGKIVFGQIISINRGRFNPTKFFDRDWSVIEEETDERSVVLSELDLTKVEFDTMLLDGEKYVNGEEKLKRLKKDGRIRLDADIFFTLWKNQHHIPESWKETINGNIRLIFFDGTVFRGWDGGHYVLSFSWHREKWNWQLHGLRGDFGASGLSAVLTPVVQQS